MKIEENGVFSSHFKEGKDSDGTCVETQRNVYRDTNAVPRNFDSTTLHLGLKEGQIASRILSVGCPGRAALIAKALDKSSPIFSHTSPRGFTTYTGTFERTRVSIIAIGMGMPMMDFLVREARQLVSKPLLITRFGTCGALCPDVAVGSVVVASPGSVSVMRNPDAFLPLPTPSGTSADEINPIATGGAPHVRPPYLVFAPQLADPILTQALLGELKEQLGSEHVRRGMNVSACSFYSSQGRRDVFFDDRNEDLLDMLRERHPSLASMEMESFQLLALARASRGSVRAAAASIVVANRPTGDVCDEARLAYLERAGGEAMVRALVRFED